MKQWNVRMIALVTVMMAVTATLTLVIQIPVPATGGYIHFGDIAANFSALAFGPWAGFLIAGGGMALADVLAGYATFAPATLIVHGLQGVVVGLIGRNRKPWLMLVAAAVGGLVVVGGYFLYEWLILAQGASEGLNAALTEVIGNIIQVSVGLVGVPIYMLVARAYPPIARWAERG